MQKRAVFRTDLDPCGPLALLVPQRVCSQAEMSCFLKRPGPLAGLLAAQKRVFSSRKELFSEQTWTLGGLLATLGPQRAVLKQK